MFLKNKPTFLAVIPARGGSKGIPGKNIKLIAGKPLIAWTIEAAKQSKYISRIILSSDDDDIIQVAQQYGCEVPFIRPKSLAQDDTPGVLPVLHAIEQCPGYDYVVLLQPTSPLRTVEDIDNAIEKVLKEKALSCVSVKQSVESPYWTYTLDDEKCRLNNVIDVSNLNISRRQLLPKTFVLNGAIYINSTKHLLINKSLITTETIGYVMDDLHSQDIDTYLDFEICELLLKTR